MPRPLKARTTRNPPKLFATPDEPPAPSEAKPRFLVVRDTREKEGKGWWFAASTRCAGTLNEKLDTGDYSLKGLEHLVCVERKGSASEFVGNLSEARFTRELDRMANFAYAVVILEFDYEELAQWHTMHPKMKRVPKFWTQPGVIESMFWRVASKYPNVHFLFAGRHGKTAANSLFKRIFEQHGSHRKAS
jgi:hypothetical protein